MGILLQNGVFSCWFDKRRIMFQRQGTIFVFPKIIVENSPFSKKTEMNPTISLRFGNQ